MPVDLVTDTIWPDADGDKAANSFKVALSKLRRIGRKQSEAPLAWVKVQEKKVSLVRSLCVVDSIVFWGTVTEALRKLQDPESLSKALDMYTADFLRADVNEVWIIHRREVLRETYIRGVKALAAHDLDCGKPEEGFRHLERAAALVPFDEELYGLTMRCHLKKGYPSKAIEVFEQARESLFNKFGVSPGPILQQLLKAAKQGG